MHIQKTEMISPAALLQSMVCKIANELKVSWAEAKASNFPKKVVLNVGKLSPEIVARVKSKLEGEGYLVEGPGMNMVCELIILVSEPEPEKHEVLIERFRKYVWENIEIVMLRGGSFPHRIKIYPGAAPEHVRVVLRELRAVNWQARYRTGSDYFTVNLG